MKTKNTKSKSTPGFRVQSSNHQGEQTPKAEPTPEPTSDNAGVCKVDFAQRHANRRLPTEQVLRLLQQRLLRAYELAEIVGDWVWIQFHEKQPREITAELSEIGFHWNNKRQTWQHPCGQFTMSSPRDPRSKYGSRHAADQQPA